MENVTFKEIISSITQLNKEKIILFKENIVEICHVTILLIVSIMHKNEHTRNS